MNFKGELEVIKIEYLKIEENDRENKLLCERKVNFNTFLFSSF